MTRWCTITVPDCSANVHRWVITNSGRKCAICSVEVIVQ